MVVKLHDIKELIKQSLNDVQWEDLIDVDFEDISNKDFYVTFSELQDIKSNPVCKSKYKISVKLCEE